MSNIELEKEYLADKKYLHSTLEHTKEHTEKLHEKLEVFKIEVTKSIAVIQTKLAIYVAGGSIVTGVLVNLIMYKLKG